ncbi:MAG: response regulator [Bacteriovoracia bacterium]
MNSPFKILIVDDEVELTEILSTIIAKDDRQIEVALNGKLALEKTQSTTFDLIICDLSMPQMSGTAFFEKARAQKVFCPFIFLTGHYDHLSEAVNLNKYGVSIFGKTQLQSMIKQIDIILAQANNNFITDDISDAIKALLSLKGRV